MNASLKSFAATDAERQARVDLAACYRLAAHFGLNEGIDNHFTLLVPGHADRFLLAPFGLHWSEVRASDFLVVDFEGRVLSGSGPIEDTALYIHLPVHKLAPQARCALHTHMPYATALTSIQDGRIEMCTQNALRYWDRIAYDENYAGVALSNDEGERMCRAMGDKEILFLRNHGVIVSGATVAQAYDDLYYLERAAMVQVLAMQTGRPLHNVSDEMAAHTNRQMAGEAQQSFLHFESLKRMLDHDEPGWRKLTG